MDATGKGPNAELLDPYPAGLPALDEVHDRMPVVLPDALHNAWLDPGLSDAAKITTIVRECAVNDFDHHPVSTRVSSPKNADAELLSPI